MNRIEFFKTHARNLFMILETQFHYVFEEERLFKYSSMDWSIQLLYFNKEKNLKIVIEQAPYYTDYGFTFSIRNISTNENVMIYNMPHEEQDLENKFLAYACALLFSNRDVLDLISGTKWQTYNRVVVE